MRLRGCLPAGRKVTRRPLAAGVAVATALAALPAVVGMLPGLNAVAAHANDYTVSRDKLRNAWDPAEPGLSPAVVGSKSFGRLPGFPVKLSGQVYAQPVVVGSTIIAATENNQVYGINRANGAILWHKSMGTPYKITGCVNIVPKIGVTSTPVYDRATGLVYLMAQEVVNGRPRWYLRGLNAATGAYRLSVPISGSPTNDSSLRFIGSQQLARPGLLLMNGWIYAAFGSHCDHKPYVGYVAGVNLATHARTLWTDESGLTGDQAGIWQSGGGLMSDGRGRIIFTSGNGVSPAPGPGTKPPGQLGDSVVRLRVKTNGSLAAADFFSPANAPALDAADEDLGSGSPVGLPFGTTTYPHLLVQDGHDGRFFVLNRKSLGGREQGPHGTDAYLAMAGPYGGVWGHPGAFRGTTGLLPPGTGNTSNDYVYNIGENDHLRVLRVGANNSGTPTVSDVANSAVTFGPDSAAPVVTSNGTDPSSAVVWAVNRSGSTHNGTLQAFQAVPSAGCTASAPCRLDTIFSASVGLAAPLSSPATSNNDVYVGSLSDYLYGFGVLPSSTALAGPSAAFRPTGVGSATTRDVSVTAHANVTVTGVSAVTTSSSADSTAAQFTVDPSQVTETPNGSTTPEPVTFPVRLHKGDKLTAPVKFAPAGPGGVTGTLSFTTTSASLPSASVALAGDGIKPGLSVSASSAQFAIVGDQGQFVSWVPVGVSVLRNITVTNSGATPEVITSLTRPPGPYKVIGLPAVGTVLRPGQSFVVQVRFAPGAASSYNDSLTVTTSRGSAVISLTGTGLSPESRFEASPSSVNLGRVPVGKQAHATIIVTDTGNEPATMKGSSHLSDPFHATYTVTPDLPVSAGDDLTLPITFTPKTQGQFTVRYRVSWTDITGAHTLTIPISGTGT